MKKFWERRSIPGKIGVVVGMIAFILIANYLKGDLFKEVDTATITREVFIPPKPISIIPLTDPLPESTKKQEIRSSSVFWGIIESSPEVEVQLITGFLPQINFYKRYGGDNYIFHSQQLIFSPEVCVKGIFYFYVPMDAKMEMENDKIVFYCHWERYLWSGIILTTAFSLLAAVVTYWLAKILAWVPYGIFLICRRRRKNRFAEQ